MKDGTLVKSSGAIERQQRWCLGQVCRVEAFSHDAPQSSQENQRQGHERSLRFEADWKGQGWSSHSDDALGGERVVNKRITKQQQAEP